MPNSRVFYKEIFLLVIHVRIKISVYIELLVKSNICKDSFRNCHFEQVTIFMKRLAVPSSSLILQMVLKIIINELKVCSLVPR